jgi:hypothetical protein
LLGHKNITMTMRYRHLSPDHLRAVVARLDNVLLAAPIAQAQDGHKTPAQQNAHTQEVALFAR